jgi:hypothetical protein
MQKMDKKCTEQWKPINVITLGQTKIDDTAGAA